MTDPPLSNLPGSSEAVAPGHPAEHRLFQSPSLLFGFLRVCIYLALWAAISFALGGIARLFLGRGLSPIAPKVLITGESIFAAAALAAAAVMSRLEKRPFGAYGLPLRGAFGKLFWQGVSFGLLEISLVIGAMAAFGSYHFGSLAIHGSEVLRWAAFWAICFLVVGFFEEFMFRGYVLFTFAQGMGFWPAAVLLSLAFGAVHWSNQGETWAGIAGVVLTGLLWCFTLQRTGNLWLAVGMHASFDFGETFLYSVPDSGSIFPGHLSSATIAGPAWITGGTAGPEASVFDFLVLLLFFYVIHRLYPPKPQTSPATPFPIQTEHPAA
jgi:membrane protease YdiL (CAAX protease family)